MNKKSRKRCFFCPQQRLTIVLKDERVFYKHCQQVLNKYGILRENFRKHKKPSKPLINNKLSVNNFKHKCKKCLKETTLNKRIY